MSVYEVHLGSWRRTPGARPTEGEPGWLDYRELAAQLIPYVARLGFTHIELLPITEHALDKSWGYQTTGYYAPTARYGEPDEFRYFVDQAHRAGLGVILDWVPSHFPTDAHGLGYFNGTHLYEHADPRQGLHPDWGTYIFNYSRPEVVSFLVSNALFWVEEYHVDGLRLDAVASMLYLDYSRADGQWIPNVHGGRENLEAVEFLRELNTTVKSEHPGVLMIAEESTAWPRVTHPVEEGGLGFDLKWNMGWMHDTLEFMETDSLFRSHVYDRLTFSLLYAFSERFQLPLSHDEVVHLKRSLLSKMPGPDHQKFANLRCLLGYMWTHPGKKLIFMGGELGDWREWNEEGEIDWPLADSPPHAGLRTWLRALNEAYRDQPALGSTDFDSHGFEWIDCHDPNRTIVSYLRWAPEWSDFLVVVINFTPVERAEYDLAVPYDDAYRILLDSDAAEFGGAAVLQEDTFRSEPRRLHGRDHVVRLTLPPLSVLILAPETAPHGQEETAPGEPHPATISNLAAN